MRKAALTATLLITGCNAAPPPGVDPPVRGGPGGHVCQPAGLDRFVGQPATAEIGSAILSESGASTLRWIPHGSAVTMDFRTDRVNVKLDTQNRIEAVTCG